MNRSCTNLKNCAELLREAEFKTFAAGFSLYVHRTGTVHEGTDVIHVHYILTDVKSDCFHIEFNHSSCL